MKVLVTGGGGFLGRYIVEQLLNRGDHVRVFCRGRYPDIESMGVEFVHGDLRDAAAVRRACQKMEAVFHTAAVPGVWGTWRSYYSINTLGTENVLAAAQSQGVRKFVYTSSPSVIFDGTPHEKGDESLPYPETFLCHYPHSKALAEQKVRAANGQSDLQTVCLRPHLIWGPRDNHLIPRLIQKAKSGRLRIVGTGKNQISMAYVENVAAAHLQACEALGRNSPVNGNVYFINEPEPVLLWDWINDILALAGLPLVEKSISFKTAYRMGHLLEWIYWLLHLPGEPPMTRFVACQLAQSHSYQIDRARRDFGYHPIVSVEEGLQRMQPELKALAAEGRR